MSDLKESKVLYVTWNEFIDECKFRFNSFISHPILFLYFTIVVFAVGSSGVWVPFITENTSDSCFNIENTVCTGIATYCIALLAAAMADNLLSPEKIKTVRFFIFCLFLLSFTLSYVTLITKSVTVAIFAVLFTIVIWILNYSGDSAKKDEIDPNPENVTGGPVDINLPGSIEGFKS